LFCHNEEYASAASVASSTTSSQRARKNYDRTKLKVDGKVKDVVYLWAMNNFKGQTGFSHQLVLDADGWVVVVSMFAFRKWCSTAGLKKHPAVTIACSLQATLNLRIYIFKVACRLHEMVIAGRFFNPAILHH
jgi:hypothetical protein